MVWMWCLASLAQQYVVDMKQWGTKDGLNHRRVNGIYQDREGMIWVATHSGLSRFDGYKFTNFALANSGVESPSIVTIAQDTRNRLWLYKNNNTIDIFDPFTGDIMPHTRLTGDSLGIPSFIYAMADGSVMIAGPIGDNTFSIWSPGRPIRRMKFPAGYDFVYVLQAANCLLAKTKDGLLAKIDLYGRVVGTTTCPRGNVLRGIEQNAANAYFVDRGSGQRVRVSADLEVTDLSQSLPKWDSTRSLDLFDAGPGGLLCCAEQLYMPGVGTIHDMHGDKQLCYGIATRAILRDRNGDLWMGNEMGLNKVSVKRSKFSQYYIQQGGPATANACRGICTDNGTLYVRNEYNGLFGINMASGVSRMVMSGPGYGLQRTSKGIATSDLCLLDKNARPTCYRIKDAYYEQCWSILELRPGYLLLGMNMGLRSLDLASGKMTKFTAYNRFPEVANNLVLHIGKDRDGRSWVCCNTGLYLVDEQQGLLARYSSNDTGIYHLPASDIQHFTEDEQGIMWLATTRGLIRWDRARHATRLYSETDGLSANIYAVYDDGRGNLWMSSDLGIMRMNKTTGSVLTFLEGDGITNNEFNRISHYRDDTGRIYFGSLYGVTAFHPKDFDDPRHGSDECALVVTSFQQFNGQNNKLENRRKELANTGRIVMQPDDRFFTLEFALLNYHDVEHTMYYWKIDDIDTGWNAQTDRTLRFSRLPYDTHRLRIRARGADGSPAKNELVILLDVVRPFYLRRSFVVSMALLAVIAVVSIYWWRSYSLRRENMRLDGMVRERTSDLQEVLKQKDVLLKEIHHRVKNNLQVISSMLRLQANGLRDEAAKAALMEGQNRVMSIALVHQKLYQEEKLDAVRIDSFVQELFDQLKHLFSEREVKLEHEVPDIFLNVNIAVPIGLLLNELMTNSFKYAFANVPDPGIWISIRRMQDDLVLTYADNGPGLPGGALPHKPDSLGLSLVQMLTRQMHGAVTYNNEGRSTFTITMPAH